MTDLLTADPLPTVNITSAMARYERAERRLKAITKVYEDQQAEFAAAQGEYERAKSHLASGHAQSGLSHSRFDRQTLVWVVDPEKMAEHMQPQCLRILQVIFASQTPGATPETKTLSGAELRTIMETKFATKSPQPLRMYHCFRGEFIRRGILRQI